MNTPTGKSMSPVYPTYLILTAQSATDHSHKQAEDLVKNVQEWVNGRIDMLDDKKVLYYQPLGQPYVMKDGLLCQAVILSVKEKT
jgi:hypothetical protein